MGTPVWEFRASTWDAFPAAMVAQYSGLPTLVLAKPCFVETLAVGAHGGGVRCCLQLEHVIIDLIVQPDVVIFGKSIVAFRIKELLLYGHPACRVDPQNDVAEHVAQFL